MSAYKSAKILKDTEEIVNLIQSCLAKREGIWFSKSRILHVAVLQLQKALVSQKQKEKKDVDE